ncbi:MAG: hypothetical protein FWE63_01825, partial [Bacteroidales bacterium]|nr:hypothetical protein [Bacteroidales bacterium]
FTENIFNELYNDEHLLQLLDSIAALIANGGDVHNFIQEIVNQISQDTYITQLGDSIVNYITNNFPEELGQTILNYITNNVTQELTDSIMANVVVEGDNGIIVEGSGTSNITVKLPEGGKDGQLLVWNHTLQTWAPTDPLPTTKQVTIPVANGTFNTENLIFYGSTAATTNPLQVISIEPIFANPTLRRNFLRVNAEFQVEDRVIEWSVSIENRNFNPINEFTLVSIIITYICGDTTPLTSDTQGYSILVGY